MDPSRKRKKLEKIWTVGTASQMLAQETVTVMVFSEWLLPPARMLSSEVKGSGAV